MSYYERLIREIDPSVDPRHVECHMRAQYGTLNHLDDATFRREIRLFKACEAAEPGYGAALAKTYGVV